MQLPLLQWLMVAGTAHAFLSGSAQRPAGGHGVGRSRSPAASGFSSISSSSSSSSRAPSYRDDLVSLHKSLVEIQSVSFDENEVGQFLVDYLSERDFATDIQFLPTPDANGNHDDDDDDENEKEKKPRFNVLAWSCPSTSCDPHRRPDFKVVVTSHIDTVPPFIPYSRTDEDGKTLSGDTVFSGRGSVDAKASVAAQITAVTELLSADEVKPDDVLLVFVVGEERSGDGMRAFSRSAAEQDPPLEISAAIFGEPTEGKLACGHKGFFDCVVTAHGKAGHSGYPWLGKSANEVLMRALIKVLDTDLGSSEEFGNTTVNIGLVQGGVAPNVIAEKAVSKIAGRVAIGPQHGGSEKVVERLIEVLKSVDADALEYDCYTGYGVVKCECEVDGFDTAVMNYGTDVANYQGNHTSYLYGPGTILVAHGPDEALTLGELEDSVEGYQKLILHAVRKADGDNIPAGEMSEL